MEQNDRFLDLYNRFDAQLREYYQADDKIFSVIKRYEDQLKKSSIAKNREKGFVLETIRTVRNTLVHEAKVNQEDAFQISNEVILFLEKEIQIISHPLRAIETLKPMHQVFHATLDSRVVDVTKRMSEHCFSHTPVLDENGCLIGVFSESTLYSYLLKHARVELDENVTVQEFFPFILLQNHASERYAFLSKNAFLSTIVELFDKKKRNEKRLVMIFVTENGKVSEKILGILTLQDLIAGL